MRLFSYRNRTKFRKIGITLLIIILFVTALVLGVLAYLGRYIVYDQDGAHLDFDLDTAEPAPTVVTPAVDAVISYVSPDDEAAIGTTRKVTGYYVTTEMLQDLDAVRSTLDSDNYYAVLFDLKDSFGYYYYPSSLSGAQTASSVDTQAVAELIDDLSREGVYLIARIPAFADQLYCLNHTDLGLPLSSGALWADGNGCYWMDPADASVISYLETICTELQAMGFREVVLEDYRFPDTDAIVYDETEKSKAEILSDTAEVLQTDMDLLDLRVSFGLPTDQPLSIMLTEGRLYFELEDGAGIDPIVDTHEASVTIPDVQIVFLTESHDTRFEAYGHLAPVVESSVPEDDGSVAETAS